MPKSYKKTTTFDWDGNGVPDSIDTEKFTYKNGGPLLTKYEHTSDYGGDGKIDYSSWTKNTYQGNNLTKAVTETDFDGNGVFDQRSVTKNTFKNNIMVKSVTETDNDLDGDIDYKMRIDNTLNKKNQIIETLTRTDWDANGTWDQTDSVAFEYNKGGDLVAEYHDFGDNSTIDIIVEYAFA